MLQGRCGVVAACVDPHYTHGIAIKQTEEKEKEKVLRVVKVLG
jgi:hypothetical protein